MKKLILTLTVAAFTVGAFAGGENCAASKDKAACGDKDKTAAACPAGKDAAKCPATGATAKKDGEAKPADAAKDEQKKS
jgi:hypothetical protein